MIEMAMNRNGDWRKIMDPIYKCKEDWREKIDPVGLEFGVWVRRGRVKADHCNGSWGFEFELCFVDTRDSSYYFNWVMV